MLLEHGENRGQGAARNSGAENATGEIVVFIDSDVVVYPDVLKKMTDRFRSDRTLSVVVGVPDKSNKYHNLATIHFIMRVFYNYMRLPDYVTHTNGTILGVRRKIFEEIGGFNEKVSGIEDDEFGMDIYQNNGKIFLDKTILVQHNKAIDFLGLIKNDMLRTVDRVFYIFRRKLLKATLKEKRFISTPISQIVSSLMAPFNFIFPVLIFYSPVFFPLTIISLSVFYFLNSNYLTFVKKEKNLIVAVKIFLLLMVDMLFVHIALWIGVIQYTLGKRY
jgi:cellulose synthase/poly-beta-1,6-N-acetylglucosamine synthase-like glycosyltransferase